MTDPSKPREIVQFAIASSKAFSALFPEFLFQYTLPENQCQTYATDFIQAIDEIIRGKSFQPIQKFYGLYLLFRASELEDKADLMGQLTKNNELISELFKISQTDLTNRDVFPNERGKTYFGRSPSKYLLHIGMNFVRLCYETLSFWGSKYGDSGSNESLQVYRFLADTLKKKGKQPVRHFFIGQNYDLSSDIATWDFRKDPPPVMKEKFEEDEAIQEVDDDLTVSAEEDRMSQRSENNTPKTLQRTPTKSFTKVMKASREQEDSERVKVQNDQRIKARIARLGGILQNLKDNNQLTVQQAPCSLDNLDYKGNTDSGQTPNSNSQTSLGTLESTPEGMNDLRRAKEIKKHLDEIQVSIQNCYGLKSQANPFVNISNSNKGKKAVSLNALPSETKAQKQEWDEEKLKEEYSKFMGLTMGKQVTFGEEMIGSCLSNANGSESRNRGRLSENSRMPSLGNLEFVRLESKHSAFTLACIEEEKQYKSVALPREERQTRKHDPFSKTPIPDQRIPNSYKITQVVVEDEQGKRRKSVVASREFGQGELRAALVQSERRISELERETMMLKQTNYGLQIRNKDKTVQSLPNLGENANSHRSLGEFKQTSYQYPGRTTPSQSVSQVSTYSTRGI